MRLAILGCSLLRGDGVAFKEPPRTLELAFFHTPLPLMAARAVCCQSLLLLLLLLLPVLLLGVVWVKPKLSKGLAMTGAAEAVGVAAGVLGGAAFPPDGAGAGEAAKGSKLKDMVPPQTESAKSSHLLIESSTAVVILLYLSNV